MQKQSKTLAKIAERRMDGKDVYEESSATLLTPRNLKQFVRVDMQRFVSNQLAAVALPETAVQHPPRHEMVSTHVSPSPA